MIEKLIADLHSHTLASTHAYSTIYENTLTAREKGLKILAMTDHGPQLADSADILHFKNSVKAIPDTVNGVIVLKGMEANFLPGGKTDCPPRVYRSLDLVLCGFHRGAMESQDRDANTDIVLKAIQSGSIDVVAHPGDPNYPKDLEAIVRCAAEYGVAIEINAASGAGSRVGSNEFCLETARLCKKYHTTVSVGSDSHFMSNIGNLRHAIDIINEAGIPEELIINTSVSRTLDFALHRGHPHVETYFRYLENQL
ncbi:PHP domain-containing protein [Succinimonas amylolytica]|uniref:PHP domain-containing protein n=1 Tax=Succinimonas amylolytica TaxID=83769 RepID=UPI00037A4028|nr:PHP domain-containing protein [Succinimonas amylolytica]